VKPRFTPQALAELDAILDYIAERSPHVSVRHGARDPGSMPGEGGAA
jgi:plasmid stabilization system protein ParE